MLIGVNFSTKTRYWGIDICKVHFLPTFITQFLQLELRIFINVTYQSLFNIFLSNLSYRHKINLCILQPNYFHLSVTSGKNGSLIWILGGKKCVFLIKTVLNGGMC